MPYAERTDKLLGHRSVSLRNSEVNKEAADKEETASDCSDQHHPPGQGNLGNKYTEEDAEQPVLKDARVKLHLHRRIILLFKLPNEKMLRRQEASGTQGKQDAHTRVELLVFLRERRTNSFFLSC